MTGFSEFTMKCPMCGEIVFCSKSSFASYCSKGHLVNSKECTNIKKKDNLNFLKLSPPFKPKEQQKLYDVEIEKSDSLRGARLIFGEWIFFIKNVREGEIIDLIIEKIINNKIYCNVFKYKKIVGKKDYAREINKYHKKESVSFSGGGLSRNKCASVILPSERIHKDLR